MSGYIIKTISGEEIWNGTSWTPEMYANERTIKVYPTLVGAQREVNQLEEERPGMAQYLMVVEA